MMTAEKDRASAWFRNLRDQIVDYSDDIVRMKEACE